MIYTVYMNLSDRLQEIDSLKIRLDAFRPLSSNQTNNLKRLFDVDLTYNSTAIEGNTLTLQETRVVLLDGITIGGKTTREHLEILNHKEAIDYVEVLSKNNIDDYTKSDILALHSIVMRGIDSENAGRYRNVSVYVRLKDGSVHQFCDPLKILDEMEYFLKWLNSSKEVHPVLFAAEVHTRFVSIHPFVDGNGRTARLLMNLILIHFGYPPAVIKMSKRTEYLDSIEKWQQDSSKIEFQMMLADSVYESLTLYLETLKKNIIWK